MKKSILILTILFSAGPLLAQFSGNPNTYNITGPQNILKSEIPLAEPSITGSTYLDDQWHDGGIVLKDGYRLEDLPVRIEIEHGNVEIKYRGEVKFLDLKKVDFINYAGDQSGARQVIEGADRYVFNDVPLRGIVLVHKGKRYDVIKHFYIEFLQANYNVAMDVGSKDHRKVKKEKIYIALNNRLILVKGKEKKIVSQLGAD